MSICQLFCNPYVAIGENQNQLQQQQQQQQQQLPQSPSHGSVENLFSYYFHSRATYSRAHSCPADGDPLFPPLLPPGLPTISGNRQSGNRGSGRRRRPHSIAPGIASARAGASSELQIDKIDHQFDLCKMPPGRYCKFQFNWRITGFLEKIESRENHHSPTFTTNYQGKEFRWKLCLKKYADNERILPGYYGMYIEYQGPFDTAANTSAVFYFLSDNGDTIQNMTLDRRNYSASERSYGIGYYIRLNKVRQLVCRDGSANFHAILMIEEGDFAETSPVESPADAPQPLRTLTYPQQTDPPHPPLPSATAALLSKILSGENRYSDIDITSSDGITFHCHKAILSENDIFYANFAMDTRDSRHNHIHLEDIPSIVLKELLRYLYTGRVEGLADVAQGLLYAAEKYMLQHLKELCEDELMRHLNAENATTLLLIADNVGAQCLKERCISVVLSERQNIVRSSQWSQVLCRKDLMNEILLRIDEKAMFLGVCEVEAKN